MNDIAEYERRITAALERIHSAIEDISGQDAAAPAGADEALVADLQAALESERLANGQLTERVRVLKERHETIVAELERKVERLTEQLDAAGRDAQQMKALHDDLTDANHALAAAAERGVADPDLINRSMMTELQALRAARAAEIAEMDEILSELKPLIGEVA